ncbi:hypothetical protein BTVI_83963 [Pitangus sulphuratus]|nr:hypothetical protein BTVI_83963 [Pitangus sulphuratus]
MPQYRLGSDLLESSSMEKNLGVLVDTNLPMSWQCSLVPKKANGIRECIRKNIASRLREVILPLYAALVSLHWSAMSSSGLLRTRETWSSCSGSNLGQATKMIRGLEHLSYKGRLRELGIFNLRRED